MGANAQTIVPTFTASQVLTADQMNQSARTGVPVFATTTTRDAAFGGTGEKTLAEGQLCFIEAAPKRFQVYNGTAWIDFDVAWQDFTPTISNVTIGNGTRVARYVRIGKTVAGYVKFTLGTTSAVTGRILITLPTTANTNAAVVLSGYYGDTGVQGYLAYLEMVGSDIYTAAVNTAGTYATPTPTSGTVPFSWGSTDVFTVNFVYEEA